MSTRLTKAEKAELAEVELRAELEMHQRARQRVETA